MRRKNVAVWSIICIVLLTSVVLAQVSTNYDAGWWVVSSGGGTRQSAAYLIVDAVGQQAGDVAVGSTTVIESGFLAGVTTHAAAVYLPVVVR
jgi:hypothetical protein